MNLLPKWVLPPSLPSVHDSESFTALEMVAKVYGAMNSLIAECNELNESTKTEVSVLKQSHATEMENFKQYVEQRLACKFNELDALQAEIRLAQKKLDADILAAAREIINTAITEGRLVITETYDANAESLNLAVTEEV